MTDVEFCCWLIGYLEPRDREPTDMIRVRAASVVAPAPFASRACALLDRRGGLEDAAVIAELLAAARARLRDDTLARSIADLLGNVISCLSPDGIITYVSAAARDVLGYDASELVGTRAIDLVHPDDRDAQRHGFGALVDTGASALPAITSRVQRKDGVYVYLEVACRVVRDPAGAVVEIQTAGRDVTARIEAEQALAAAELGVHALLEALPEPAVVHDRGRIVTASRAFVALLGRSSIDEVAGHDASEFVHPDDREFVAARIGSTQKNRRTPEHRLVNRRGESIPVEVTGVPFLFGGKRAALAIVHDLRERKRVDAELAASDRMVTLGRLAAAVGHEVNNPLTYMMGSLEVLRGELAAHAKSPADAAKLLERVQAALDGATRVRDIARDLKSLSSGTSEPSEPVDLERVLDRAAQTAAHEIEHRARLIRDHGDVPLVAGTEGRLIQVFVNLLVNAAHAMPDGGAGVNEIRVVTRRTADGVIVEVLDNGDGFTSEEAAQLFEPFFTTKAGAGTGLGLSIVRRIVTGFGGSVVAEPRMPRGACFRVTLVACESALAPRAAEVAIGPSSVRARVLFVDDEAMIRKIANAALDRHEVTTAGSGRDAIGLLEAGADFDAIVCDLHMPDLGGVDVYEWIVAHRPVLAPRIAFTTGGAFTERAQRFLSASEHPVIEKPFDLEELSAVITSIIEA